MANEIQKELLQIPYLEIKTKIIKEGSTVESISLTPISHLFVKVNEKGDAQLTIGGD